MDTDIPPMPETRTTITSLSVIWPRYLLTRMGLSVCPRNMVATATKLSTSEVPIATHCFTNPFYHKSQNSDIVKKTLPGQTEYNAAQDLYGKTDPVAAVLSASEPNTKLKTIPDTAVDDAGHRNWIILDTNAT